MKTAPQLRLALRAIGAGDTPALHRLLGNAPDLVEDARLLNEAALRGQAEAVRLLLSSGSDPDAPVPSHENYRPLHRAIEHRGFPRQPGHREGVEILLEAGASLEKRATWMQLIPFSVAGMVGDREMMDLLREAGSAESLFTAAITADVPAVRRHRAIPLSTKPLAL